MKMQQYIRYALSLILIFSNLSVAFSMHFCQGAMEEIKMNHLDNKSCEIETATSCCPPKSEKNHCEIADGESKQQDDCCKDVSYSDKIAEKQVVKVLKLVPIDFLAVEVLQLKTPILDFKVEETLFLLDSYVESNAPPNYIFNSQLTFYEG